MASPERRAKFTAGLRQIADILDLHPEVPLPYDGTETPLQFMFFGVDDKAPFVAAMRAFRVSFEKTSSGLNGEFFDLNGHVGGVKVNLTTMRATVCERVVVGTEIVTKKVPDPSVALVEITEEVEQVEWRCTPLLAEEVGEPNG